MQKKKMITKYLKIIIPFNFKTSAWRLSLGEQRSFNLQQYQVDWSIFHNCWKQMKLSLLSHLMVGLIKFWGEQERGSQLKIWSWSRIPGRGKGGSYQKTLPWGSMNSLWNNTMYVVSRSYWNSLGLCYVRISFHSSGTIKQGVCKKHWIPLNTKIFPWRVLWVLKGHIEKTAIAEIVPDWS